MRWLRRVGRVIAYPVTKPVDLLAKRAGRKAVDGAVARINEAMPRETPMVKNWKTSLGGISAILTIVAKVVGGGDLTATDIGVVIAGIAALFSKDKDVTGVGASATR